MNKNAELLKRIDGFIVNRIIGKVESNNLEKVLFGVQIANKLYSCLKKNMDYRISKDEFILLRSAYSTVAHRVLEHKNYPSDNIYKEAWEKFPVEIMNYYLEIYAHREITFPKSKRLGNGCQLKI